MMILQLNRLKKKTAIQCLLISKTMLARIKRLEDGTNGEVGPAANKAMELLRASAEMFALVQNPRRQLLIPEAQRILPSQIPKIVRRRFRYTDLLFHGADADVRNCYRKTITEEVNDTTNDCCWQHRQKLARPVHEVLFKGVFGLVHGTRYFTQTFDGVFDANWEVNHKR
ncbi:hypothetical protein PsorP6_012197 [Peronosclerospora sorghi]|uniref:Uncharacterized protein n=1 Tax=Peronosclerospora sorghi TaxID=230839 RepID=A0ACC0WIS3_9STRA|nr:hypothetical protein PsorP6_012197 [Peronosclerospora sorghi]